MGSSPEGVMAAGIILPTLGSIALALRFYGRRLRNTTIQRDDWMMVFGLFLTWVLGIIVIVGAAGGSLGRHSHTNAEGVDIHDSMEIYAQKIQFAFQLVEKLAFGAIKLSIILLYQRIFRGRYFDLVSRFMLGLIVVWSLSFFFATAFECGTRPYEQWNTIITATTLCFKIEDFQAAFAITDVITDLIILCIPIPMVWSLQMSVRRRLAVIGVFLIGTLSTAAGVGRMAIYLDIAYFQTPTRRDLTETITNALVWSLVEAGVGVIAACLPTIRPLFVYNLPDSPMGSLRSKLRMSSIRTSGDKRPCSHDSVSSANANLNAWTYKNLGKRASDVGTGCETYVLGNMERVREPPPGHIVVRSTLSMAESQV